MIHAIGMLLIFMLMTPSLADLWIMGNTASQQRLAAEVAEMADQVAVCTNRHAEQAQQCVDGQLDGRADDLDPTHLAQGITYAHA